MREVSRWCDGILAWRVSSVRGVCTCGREGALTQRGRVFRHITKAA